MEERSADGAVADDAFTTVTVANDPTMVVLTTAGGGERAGCLVGFHAQAGIDPQRYCVWISKANHTYRVALRAEHFAVHFLTRDDVALAEHFGTETGDDTDKFASLAFEPDEHGVPVLTACPHHFLLDRLALLDDGSDHVCLTARVRHASSTGPYEPLRVSDVDHLEPGHPAEERAVEP